MTLTMIGPKNATKGLRGQSQRFPLQVSVHPLTHLIAATPSVQAAPAPLGALSSGPRRGQRVNLPRPCSSAVAPHSVSDPRGLSRVVGDEPGTPSRIAVGQSALGA